MRQDNWTPFTLFLSRNKDTYWPDKLFGRTPESALKDTAALMLQKPNTQATPKHELSIQMARLLAHGKMSPEEVEFLTRPDTVKMSDSDDDNASSSGNDNDDDDDDDDDDSEDDDDSVESEISFDEQEMAELLASIGTTAPVAW